MTLEIHKGETENQAFFSFISLCMEHLFYLSESKNTYLLPCNSMFYGFNIRTLHFCSCCHVSRFKPTTHHYRSCYGWSLVILEYNRVVGIKLQWTDVHPYRTQSSLAHVISQTFYISNNSILQQIINKLNPRLFIGVPKSRFCQSHRN